MEKGALLKHVLNQNDFKKTTCYSSLIHTPFVKDMIT